VPQNLEQWLASKGDALEPFKAFLRKHGVDADKAVAALFASGYSARRVMFAKSSPQGKGALRPLGHGTDMEGEAEAPSAVAAAAPWEASFAAWSEVLRAEDLPHSFPDLLGRCTALLARDPAKAPATIATLRETLLNDDMLHQLIGQTPRMLGEDPLALQRRLVTLQVACAGDLHPLLQREPKLLSTKLDDVLANIRLLREHCRSQDDFRELVLLRPDLLVYRPRHLAGMVAAVKRALSSALGESIDPLAIVRCRPQLMTIPHPALTKRWSSLTQIASTVPQWQEELDSMLQDAALAPKPATSAEPASAPPAWVGLAPDQVPVGVKLDPPANPQETAEGQDVVDSEQEAPGEWGCESIADALYVPPMKYSRLRYLAEVMPDKAGDISFLDGMLVGWKRFARRFPEFDAWVKEREESKSREQRQTGTEAEEPAGQMNQAESSSNETQ